MKKKQKEWFGNWVILIQEFDLEIWHKNGIKKQVADHVSCLEKKALKMNLWHLGNTC